MGKLFLEKRRKYPNFSLTKPQNMLSAWSKSEEGLFFRTMFWLLVTAASSPLHICGQRTGGFFSRQSLNLVKIWECKQALQSLCFSHLLKFDLNKVLGLPWFEIQTKFSIYYFTIIGIFLIRTNTFSAFLNIKFYLLNDIHDIVGGLKSSNQRTLLKFELFKGWTFPQV